MKNKFFRHFNVYKCETCLPSSCTKNATGKMIITIDNVIFKIHMVTPSRDTPNILLTKFLLGCFRVSGDKMIGVIKRSPECEDKPQRKCKVAVNVNAPITYQGDFTCKIQWKRSTYSSRGQTWNSFSLLDQGLFQLKRINHETITLNVRI